MIRRISDARIHAGIRQRAEVGDAIGVRDGAHLVGCSRPRVEVAQALGFADVWEDIELYYAQTMKTDFSDDEDE